MAYGAAAKEYVRKKDTDDEVKDIKPRSKGEEDFVKQHTVTFNDDPNSDEAQHTAHTNHSGDHKGHEPSRPKSEAPKTFEKFRAMGGHGQSSYRGIDKADNGERKMPTVKEDEQIDELSKDTLKSYVKKASPDVERIKSKSNGRRDTMTDKNLRKHDNRLHGMWQAQQKLKKEEVEQFEEYIEEAEKFEPHKHANVKSLGKLMDKGGYGGDTEGIGHVTYGGTDKQGRHKYHFSYHDEVGHTTSTYHHHEGGRNSDFQASPKDHKSRSQAVNHVKRQAIKEGLEEGAADYISPAEKNKLSQIASMMKKEKDTYNKNRKAAASKSK